MTPAFPPDADVRHVTKLIPHFDAVAGPVTIRRWWRLAVGFGLVWAAGAVSMLVGTPGWKAFGAGLFVPGAGFAYTGRPIWAAVALAAVLLALFLWLLLAMETIIVPVWVLTAILAGVTADATPSPWVLWFAPVLVLALIAVGLATSRIMFARRRVRGRAANRELATVTFPISGARMPEVTESTPDELDQLRYPLDLLLQPLENYDGFTTIDQFREASLRYQLNWAQFALATAQFTRTPAFTGYLSEAQRNAIVKVLQPVNWRYWRWEHLWGNGRWNPDPIPTMNIMLSGFYGTSVGLYQSVTGDTRFDEPGALTFRDRSREYTYDYRSMSESVRRSVDGSPIALQPCEPSWIYTICNTMTLNSLALHERLHDNAPAGRSLQRVIDSYEREFLRPDGHFMMMRAKRGPSLAFPPHAFTEGYIAGFGNATMPEIARRTWWLMSRNLRDPGAVRTYSTDLIDLGNYRFGSDGYSRVAAIFGARELGDLEVADALVQSLYDRERSDTTVGGPRFPKMSVLANLGLVQALFTRENTWRDMVTFGAPEPWRTGPILAEAAYPAVQVARAVTDGVALDLVLRPGDGGGRTRVGLRRLIPGRAYTVCGAVDDAFIADAAGAAVIDIDLDKRLEVKVVPAS